MAGPGPNNTARRCYYCLAKKTVPRAGPSIISTAPMPRGGSPAPDLKVENFSRIQDSAINSVVSHLRCDFATGLGWCKIVFKSGRIYEGFVLQGKCDGPGCLVLPDRSFFKGIWHYDKLVEGYLHQRDGTVPLQYQCTQLRFPTVNEVAEILSRIVGVTARKHVLAAEIVELNKDRLPNLTCSSGLQHHTILQLPQELQEFIDRLDVNACGITWNTETASKLPDFLVGMIVEVSHSSNTFRRFVPRSTKSRRNSTKRVDDHTGRGSTAS